MRLSTNNLPNKIKDFAVISNASVQSILVESCQSDRCRLLVYCHTDTKAFYVIGAHTKTFYIIGSPAEIEWLYNELNGWTDLYELSCNLSRDNLANKKARSQKSAISKKLDSVA